MGTHHSNGGEWKDHTLQSAFFFEQTRKRIIPSYKMKISISYPFFCLFHLSQNNSFKKNPKINYSLNNDWQEEIIYFRICALKNSLTVCRYSEALDLFTVYTRKAWCCVVQIFLCNHTVFFWEFPFPFYHFITKEKKLEEKRQFINAHFEKNLS